MPIRIEIPLCDRNRPGRSIADPAPFRALGKPPEGRAGKRPFLILVALILCLSILSGWPATAAARRFSFVLDAPDNRAEEAALIVEQLAEAGIGVELRLWGQVELRDMLAKGNLQAFLTDWGSSFFDPYDLVVPKLSTGGRGNFSLYANPRVDELLGLASSSIDPQAREQAYHQVQHIIYQQCPWAFGYILDRFEGVSDVVHGYVPALDGRVNLHDVSLTADETLVVALDTEAFISLDPAAYRDRETETVVRNLFDGLVTRTPQGKVVPELAEFYRLESAVHYVFNLRPGVRFHDGRPLTAADVVFSFQRILNPFGLQGIPSPRRELLGPLVSVEAVGPSEVHFRLDKPFPLFLQALVHFQIVPEHYVRRVGDLEFARRPVGAGPFRFVEGNRNEGVVVERFADYYGGSPELPPVAPPVLQRAVFRPIADMAKRLELLTSGSAIVQGVAGDSFDGLGPTEGFRILRVGGTRAYQLEMNNAHPPFNDTRLRRAVCLAIDWQRIVDKAYHGSGRPLVTCFLPSAFGYDESLQPRVRDLAAARALLREAGYESSAGESIEPGPQAVPTGKVSEP